MLLSFKRPSWPVGRSLNLRIGPAQWLTQSAFRIYRPYSTIGVSGPKSRPTTSLRGSAAASTVVCHAPLEVPATPTPGPAQVSQAVPIYPSRLHPSTIQSYEAAFKLLNRGLSLEDVTAKSIEYHFPGAMDGKPFDMRRFLGTFRSRNNKVSWFIANSSEITEQNLEQFIEWERAAPLPRTTKTRWTPEEDVRLIQAVEKFGGKNWSAVAAQVGTRNRVCCNQRSRKIMRDPTSVTTVTPELLADVDQLLRRYNHDWSKVLPHYPHFKPYQIRSRYALWLNRTSQFSRIWDTVELERLRTAVAQLGPFRWFDVAQVVQTKSFTQCSLQWKKFTLLATRKATTLEERVRILFFLAVFHPDHIHPIVPQWLTWLPASLQDRGLQPGVHINWLVAAQWLLLTRTSGQCKDIWHSMRKQLRLTCQQGPLDQKVLLDLYPQCDTNLKRRHMATKLRISTRDFTRQFNYARMAVLFKQLADNPPSLPLYM
ncbi:hypothetical protein H4R33_004743 [Dimargaris cristalligena]|nr:hypothetical protein H4R33_004743 [Dimargaris cristalligena]